MFLDRIIEYFFLLFKLFQTLDTTWVFSTENEEWSEGPSLKEKRRLHSCFYDDQTNSVFVAGGYDDNVGLLATTEQWRLDTNQWITTPDLPERLDSSAGVASKSEQFVGFVAGGNNGVATNKIHGLRRTDLTWELMPQKLQIARDLHSMVNVPADQIPGC